MESQNLLWQYCMKSQNVCKPPVHCHQDLVKFENMGDLMKA